jgi:hypothetical protein
MSWRFEPAFFLPTFLCGRQRKVGAAPHRGNANRPLRDQGKAKTKKEKPHEPGDPQGNNTRPNSKRSKDR